LLHDVTGTLAPIAARTAERTRVLSTRLIAIALGAAAAATAAFGSPPRAVAGEPQAGATPPAAGATPTPTPAPRRRFQLSRYYKPGPSYLGVGVQIQPGIHNEFQTVTNTPSSTSFQFWTTSEVTILQRIPVVSGNDFRSYVYDHYAGPVAVVGPVARTTVVPRFNVRETELEGITGFHEAHGFYVAVATLTKRNDYGYSPLGGYGYGIGRAPDPRERVSPYFNIFHYANIGGNEGSPRGPIGFSYKGVLYRAGLTYGVARSRYFLDAGTFGERLSSRVNAPAPVHVSTGYVGIGFHY